MKKILFIIVMFMLIIGLFGCKSGNNQTDKHTCDSACDVCGFCTNLSCSKNVCAYKCQGHEASSVHVCESVCPVCRKCTDKACKAVVCRQKCPGHETTSVHTCESVCSICLKCTNQSCKENACNEKCAGHDEYLMDPCKCSLCQKCTDSSCEKEECADKCLGHPDSDDIFMESYKLNLASFNIRTQTSADTGNKAWTSRRAAVVSFINSLEADIIGLQEVKKAQFDYIKSNLSSNYSAIYFPRETASSPEGLAFIYDTTKFNLVSSERYWLSETPDEETMGWGESYYRIAAVIVLEHIETGENVKCVNTHGPLNDTANINAYKLIMERSVNDDCFTFLCGDFNATPGKLGYPTVAEELQDCRISALESPNRDHLTFQKWGTYADGDTTSHILDYCFVSKGDHVEVLSYEVHTDRWGDDNAQFLSDHYAIQTVVQITNDFIPDHTGDGFDGAMDPAN